ncbi:S66 peptidase family protein [Alkalihalobacillus sp. AL-G]|uniref:S66 family peptidase n=1 Tax=Alkalihalobacillus sp. AL-G TaxID=2926399 RepID=UPI00272D3FB3|nr:S66 peptidase family protein [Alkalihalobacillus sp. AL-G]WLD94739.1 LD-carboxypeptidase [Alkalihalobacillus sp. AL-G]
MSSLKELSERVVVLLYPKPLTKGDVIGIVATSSGVTGVFRNKLDNAIKQIEDLGYQCLESPSARSNEKLTSASPKQRAEEFLELYHNDQVKAIVPPWGGHFLMDMLPYLDFEALRKVHPKWVLGFSDTSTLLFSLTLKAGVASAHGPNALDFGSSPVDPSVLQSLRVLGTSTGELFEQTNLDSFQSEWSKVTEDVFPPYNLTEKVEWKLLSGETETNFSGRLLGGCLDTICKLIGTPYAPVSQFLEKYKEDGVIWYLESDDMNSTDIYRTLWQMKMNGWFENCRGFLFGRPTGYEDIGDFILEDAYKNPLSDSKVPIVYDVDLGHMPPQLTFINGAYAEVSYENGRGRIKQTFK